MPIGCSPNYAEFQKRIAEKKVVVGVFGLSPKGLEKAVDTAVSGYRVICFDTRDFKLDMIRRGISFSVNVNDSELLSLVKQDMISVSSDFSRIGGIDFLFIPPISVENGGTSGICTMEEMAGIVADNMRCGLIICFENFDRAQKLRTVMEGALASSGFRYDRDFFFGSYALN